MIINFFLTFLLAFYLIICKTQIIYDDDVPFVFYKSQIFLRKYGDGSIKQEQQIDYSSKNFQSAPIVILGIGFYNNLWNPINQILFRLTSSSTTKTSCNISLIYDPNSSKLYGIQANLLAIDISQFPFVKIIDQSQKDIKFDNQYQFIEKRKYSPELQGNKNAIVVINGWKSSAISSEDVRFSLNVFVTIIDDQNYTITISTSQYSQTIVDVYYTIIEYVIDPPSMYGIVANYDEKYKAKTGEKCFYTNGCTNDQRYFPVQFNIVKLKNSQTQKQQYSNFFASINQFDFETKKFNLADGSDPRIQLVNFIYQQGKIQYEYNVWDNTICYGSTSSSIFFYKKLCLVNQYLLIDKQICQDDQPIGYYCKYIDQLYQCQNCKINDCQEYQKCLSCNKNYILNNNKCQNNKNSQVDNKKLEVSEIKETYEIINNQTYQAMQDTVKSASFLAVSSIGKYTEQYLHDPSQKDIFTNQIQNISLSLYLQQRKEQQKLIDVSDINNKLVSLSLMQNNQQFTKIQKQKLNTIQFKYNFKSNTNNLNQQN
ncbi:hypothetical protein ABPG74_009539 [Tetrahymena malaccensis]